MKHYLVGITIDKIQSYLYYQLTSKAQESQSNSKTLQSVIQASNFISKKFSDEIKEAFSNTEKQELLACSGKYIFVSSLPKEEIQQRLQKLFGHYYQETNGQLLLKYVYIDQEEIEIKDNGVDEQLQLINAANKKLKSGACLNNIIEQNQEILFQFNEENQSSSVDKHQEEKYPYFALNINALAGNESSDNSETQQPINENHFRIAVIQADLDGMGKIFESIKDYSTYKQISEILTEFVSLERIHFYTEKVRKSVKENIKAKKANWKVEELSFEMYPLYVAGDDLFFAVRVEHLVSAIEVCKQLLTDINNELENINGSKIKLSLSLGIDLTFNREPIRYYYEKVKAHLMMAKSQAICFPNKEDENAQQVATLKICLNDTIYLDFDYNYKKTKEQRLAIRNNNPNIPTWFNLTQDAIEINKALEKVNQSNIGNRFFYTLLEKLNTREFREIEKNSDELRRYSNAILYHLLPQTWATGDRDLQEAEFTILSTLIELISAPVEEKKPKPLVFNEKTIKKLDSFIRGILIFTDSRFNVLLIKKREGKSRKNLKNKGTTILINRSIKFLYEQSLVEKADTTLRAIFIKKESYCPDSFKNKNKKIGVNVYRTLDIGTSMFHRMKQCQEEKERNPSLASEYNEAILNMISFKNDQSREAIEQEEEKRRSGGQAPPKLWFNREDLADKLSTKEWNTDYIDSLLIFYKLKQLSMGFKTKIKKGDK
jgi:hypothetical protein